MTPSRQSPSRHNPPSRNLSRSRSRRSPPTRRKRSRQPELSRDRRPDPRRLAVPKSALVVVEAQLCRDVRSGAPGASGWRCDAATSPVAQGRLLFYTRVKSPAATTLEHRWYRGDRLRQRVELTIRANPGSGYRTYSRNTVFESGEWRVELRTRDGVLLHEERFTVR